MNEVKNMLDRFRFSLFADDETKKKSIHTFLITKEDGSQKYFKALTCEFKQSKGEATFYQVGQMVSGTKFNHVINVEILEK